MKKKTIWVIFKSKIYKRKKYFAHRPKYLEALNLNYMNCCHHPPHKKTGGWGVGGREEETIIKISFWILLTPSLPVYLLVDTCFVELIHLGTKGLIFETEVLIFTATVLWHYSYDSKRTFFDTNPVVCSKSYSKNLLLNLLQCSELQCFECKDF